MAGGGGSLGVERVKRGKASKRKKKKRVGFHLDMTPLVDITFLLLTFFMFTTTMAAPQVMEMSIPPEVEVDVEVKASQLFTVYVDNENELFYSLGLDAPEPLEMKDLKALAEEKNLDFVDDPENRNKLITAVKVSKLADYGLVVDVLDELNLAELKITEETAKFNDESGMPAKRERRFALSILSEVEYEEFQKQLTGGEE